MQLPRFFIVGDRPVKAVATPEGGMDVLAWDWDAKTFVREMGYLSRIMLGDDEVDEVPEKDFDQKVLEVSKR